MGLIWARFKASNETSKEKLERIDDEIRDLESHKYSALRQQKNLIGLLLLVSTLIYIVGSIVYYFYYLPFSVNWQQKCINALPLVIFPFIVYLLKRSLQWYYVWTIDLKEEKLRFLRSEKKKILERVMETETYKVAKELLEKYDPSALKERPSVTSASPDTNLRSTRLRYRGSMPPLPPNLNFQSPSLQARPSTSLIRPDRMSTPRAIMPSPQSTANMRMSTPPPPRLSRPIVSQDRGVVEKLVDYIVGDGPSNRYALICSNCHGHNGMALADEFEFMSFRCCYCGYFNSARKQKAFAPPLLTLASTSNTTSNTTNLTTRGERGLSPVIDEPESDNENKENSGDSFKITEIEEVSSTGQPSSASSEAVTQGENASVSDTIDKENENSLPKVEENGDKAINTENNAEPSEPLSSAKSDLDEKAFGTDFDFVDEVTPDNA